MVRVLIGSIVAAIAMFITGFVFWATPLSKLGLSSVDVQQSANVQAALAANLPHTGVYMIPWPDTPEGTAMFGRGPIASVDYNTAGASLTNPTPMIVGFVQEVIVALFIGLGLLAISGRVTDFPSRIKVALALTGAAAILITTQDPIFMHGDWRHALYNLIACFAVLAAGSFVLVKWFLPKPISVSLR
ncbi:hypothetical protein [Sphingomonas sp. ID0503]|uniref:hypothetical protein n=1 Tax=Sphingomonas sp. ID0503 TaxID=3399691 RepID=UPI003AFA310D